MVSSEVHRLGKKVRRKTNLETVPAIIANDGIHPYSTRKKGWIRVQEQKGAGYLPAIEVRMFASVVVSAGRNVRLGYRDDEYGVIWVDFDAEEAVGENPAVHNGADVNAHAFTDLSKAPILLAHPNNPPDLTIMVGPIWRELPTGFSLYMPTSRVDFTTEVGAITTGYQKLAGLFLTPGNTVEKVLGTEFIASDPIAQTHIDEVYAARTPGAWPVKLYKLVAGMTAIADANEHLDMRQFISAPPVSFSTASLSTPPTLAELNAEFGTPGTVGVLEVILDIGGTGTDIYRLISTGSDWAYTTYVVAT